MLSRTFLAVCLSATCIILSSPAQATSLDEAKAAIAEATALRAAEFSPAHFSRATNALNEAETLLRSDSDRHQAEQLLNESVSQAQKASELSQQFTTTFSSLVEFRDRLKMAGDNYIRDDLGKRSRKEFALVVKSAEKGHPDKAEKEAKHALRTFRAALTVAAREQFERPISKTIAQARKLKARKHAPKAIDHTLKIRQEITHLIKSNPDAQSKAYSLLRQGQESGNHAIRISRLGLQLDRHPEVLESWIDANDTRIAVLAEAIGIQLDSSLDPDGRLAQLKQGIEDMKAEHHAQINDAEKQIHALSEKLTQYEGELSDMAEVRRKLQLRREAEAKIKRLTKLFDPEEVEILLTPEADVILRMKKLNFLSGSAVIPPKAYSMLDHAIQSIEIFPDRAVRIEGHTDFMGSNTYNQKLSRHRADAVRNYLLLQMPGNEARFSAIGHGEDKPIANNETAEGRTKNRRIDIILLAPPVTNTDGQAG